MVRVREVSRLHRGIDLSHVEIGHPEHGFGQEAGEHPGGDDHPLDAVLGTQEPTDIELRIERGVGAIPANDLEVRVELPGNVSVSRRRRVLFATAS